MYADLLREYQFDLTDLFQPEPTTTPSLVLALIENLPSHSATSAKLRDAPDSIGWDTNAYLAAALIDSVRDGTFVNMQVRTKKKLKPFERVQLPGGEGEKKTRKKPVSMFVRMAQQAMAQAREVEE